MHGASRHSQMIEVTQLDQGLDLATPPARLPAGALRHADNWLFRGPSLVTRPGYTRFTPVPLPHPVTGMARYDPKSGPAELITVTSDGNVWSLVSPFTSGYNNIAINAHSGNPWHFANFAGLLIGAGVQEMKRYDGVTWNPLGGGAPHARYVISHTNRLAVANTAQHPSRVHFSSPGNPQSWPAGLYQDFEPKDQDEITGLAVIHGILVVFKRNSVWVMYGTEPSNYTPQQMVTNLGCIAPRSIQVIAGKVYWLSNDGVWSFDGSTFDQVSRPVAPLLRRCAALDQAAAGQWDGNYLLAYPSATGSTNDAILVYNIPKKAWLRHTAPAVSLFERFPRHDDAGLFAAQAGGGLIYHLAQGSTDDGEPITSTFRTGHIGQLAGRQHRFRHVAVATEAPADPQVNLAVTAHSGTGSRSIGVQAPRVGLPAHMQGQAIDVQFSTTTDNGPVTVHGLVIERVTRRLR